PGQSRLQQVGSVVLSSLPSSTDHGVGFVNEQNDGRGRRLDFLDQAFQSVLKFSFDARASLKQSEIQSVNADVSQRWWNITSGNPRGKAFHNRGFAHARFAGEDRIVLATA